MMIIVIINIMIKMITFMIPFSQFHPLNFEHTVFYTSIIDLDNYKFLCRNTVFKDSYISRPDSVFFIYSYQIIIEPSYSQVSVFGKLRYARASVGQYLKIVPDFQDTVIC